MGSVKGFVIRATTKHTAIRRAANGVVTLLHELAYGAYN